MEQSGKMTQIERMTISHNDLPFVKESVIHLLELGIKNIDVRIVNEDVWKEGDDVIYENQLISLADYLMDNDTLDCHLSCFHEEKGMPISDNVDISCGNKVLAIDSYGNLYPCHRFASYSLRTKSPLIIGDVFNGVDKNKMRKWNEQDGLAITGAAYVVKFREADRTVRVSSENMPEDGQRAFGEIETTLAKYWRIYGPKN